MLLDKVYPPDIRVRKEVSALCDEGHNVTIVANRGDAQVPSETIIGATVVRIDHSSTLLEMVEFNRSFVYPHRRDFLTDLVHQRDVDAIHAHDLNMVPTAAASAAATQTPLIADFHENYPEAVRQWRRKESSPRDWLRWLLRPVRRFKGLEQRCVRQADEIITVIEEGKTHYVEDCGAAESDVTVVSNTVDLSWYDEIPRREIDVSGDPLVTYVGGFGAHRGIETAVRAFPDVLDVHPEATLLLVGAGSAEYERRLKTICSDLGIMNAVQKTGWVEFNRVPSYIEASDVCFVLHESNPHTESTIPHKLFQYMASAVPVVASDVGPIQRIVKETKCGIATDGTLEQVADAIIDLGGDPSRRSTFGNNGREAVEMKYNWQTDGARLCHLYETINC